MLEVNLGKNHGRTQNSLFWKKISGPSNSCFRLNSLWKMISGRNWDERWKEQRTNVGSNWITYHWVIYWVMKIVGTLLGRCRAQPFYNDKMDMEGKYSVSSTSASSQFLRRSLRQFLFRSFTERKGHGSPVESLFNNFVLQYLTPLDLHNVHNGKSGPALKKLIQEIGKWSNHIIFLFHFFFGTPFALHIFFSIFFILFIF